VAEAHHDVCVLDAQGRVLGKARIADGVAGVAALHALVGAHSDDGDEPGEVVVGIETDRELLVAALVAAGYRVYAVNPLAVSRYRDRHQVSGAKSDPGDAKVLADLVRTDRHVHRPVAGDSDLAEAHPTTPRRLTPATRGMSSRAAAAGQVADPPPRARPLPAYRPRTRSARS
jgi:transposase